MIRIVGKRDPLSEVIRGTNRIQKAINDLASKFPQRAKNPNSAAHHLIPLRDILKDMQRLIKNLSRERKVSGIISPLGASALSNSFESIMAEFRWLNSGQLLGDAFPSRHPLFKRAVEEVGRLKDEINRLTASANSTNDLVDREKDHLYEVPRRLRAAIRDLDKKAAKNVGLGELGQWCFNFPPIDWEDQQMVQRAAKVYLLNLIPFQVWEVRYRSEAPGRPLVLAIATSDFPDSELLSWCDTTYGIQKDYYFAAKQPSWRLVWRTSWYAF